jgi:hypothetical protein
LKNANKCFKEKSFFYIEAAIFSLTKPLIISAKDLLAAYACAVRNRVVSGSRFTVVPYLPVKKPGLLKSGIIVLSVKY